MKCQEAAEKMHNEELRNVCCPQNIITIIKPRRRWAGLVAHTRKMETNSKLLLEFVKELFVSMG
jgi:hypothetical protein